MHGAIGWMLCEMGGVQTREDRHVEGSRHGEMRLDGTTRWYVKVKEEEVGMDRNRQCSVQHKGVNGPPFDRGAFDFGSDFAQARESTLGPHKTAEPK